MATAYQYSKTEIDDAMNNIKWGPSDYDPHRRTPNQIHATKTAICQMLYNRMEITDMDQMKPDGPYMEV